MQNNTTQTKHSQLWLDELLPRVAATAETDANRASRVAACELLHGLVLWMIGEHLNIVCVYVCNHLCV